MSPSRRAAMITKTHVGSNVTALVLQLMEYDDEKATWLIMGDEEGDYTVGMVSVVSPWLARRLKENGQRVAKWDSSFCWARPVTSVGPDIDPIIREIAGQD